MQRRQVGVTAIAARAAAVLGYELDEDDHDDGCRTGQELFALASNDSAPVEFVPFPTPLRHRGMANLPDNLQQKMNIWLRTVSQIPPVTGLLGMAVVAILTITQFRRAVRGRGCGSFAEAAGADSGGTASAACGVIA